jgi:RimJ/RimL family protein N-acetyltransferase
MDFQPVLESDYVLLRALQSVDLEPLYQVAKDPMIWKQHPCQRNLRPEFEKFFIESIRSKGALIVIDKKTNTIIGSSRYNPILGFENGVEIGWTFLSRNYWGGKYNKEIKNLMIEHAFKFVENILFYIDINNIRSQRAAEKLNGRKLEGLDDRKLASTDSDIVTYVLRKNKGSNETKKGWGLELYVYKGWAFFFKFCYLRRS